MSKKKRAPEGNLAFLAGLYTRVAKQAGVHPSYVSRVARGERRSELVSRALADELAQFVPARGSAKVSEEAAGSGDEYRRRLLSRLRKNSELSKLKTTIVEVEHWGSPRQVPQVSRVNLQSRIAANAAMIAASMEQFYRMARKLERFPHVLSLTDREGVVLYSLGSTGTVRQHGRVPGAHWGGDHAGPSAAGTTIAAGVPVIMIANAQQKDGLLSVRMGCPIRLGNGEVAGVVVLSIDLPPARAEHLIDIAKLSRKICQIVEDERKKGTATISSKQRGGSVKALGA